MKQLRSKKRSQQWIAVLLAVVMVVGHMAMASAYDPNAGGDGYINAPLLDLTNGGSGAGTSEIGDGSGTGGNGVQAGSSDGGFVFDPYANTITGSNGEALPPVGEGEGEEEAILLDPDTFGEGADLPPADEFDIVFTTYWQGKNDNPPKQPENGTEVSIKLAISSQGGSSSVIPEDTPIKVTFPSFVPAAGLWASARELYEVRGVVKDNYDVLTEPDGRKTLYMYTTAPEGDNLWQLTLDLAVKLQMFYYNGDETVQISVGNSVHSGNIDVDDDYGEWDGEEIYVSKKLLNASDIFGSDYIEGNIAAYQVDVKLPTLKEMDDLGQGQLRATIEDTIQNTKFALCLEDGTFDYDAIKELLLGAVRTGLINAGMTAENANDPNRVWLDFITTQGAEGHNGFKINIIGKTEEPVNIKLIYYATPTTPISQNENEFVRNKVIVTYGDYEKGEDEAEVLVNKTSAALWRKRINNGESYIILPDDDMATTGVRDITFEFVVTALGGASVSKGQIIVNDNLDPAFTFKSSEYYSGISDDVGILKDNVDKPDADKYQGEIGVYGNVGERNVKIVANKGGTLSKSHYDISFVAQMDLSKILPGQSGKNKVDNDIVHIYRDAELTINKLWEKDELPDVVKGAVTFTLHNSAGKVVGTATLNETQVQNGESAKIRFNYFTDGILDGKHTYTLRESVENEDSTYSAADPQDIVIEKYTNGDEHGVRFVKEDGTYEDVEGLYTTTFENPYDDSKGEIEFRKYGKKKNFLREGLDGAIFTIEMGVSNGSTGDHPSGVNTDYDLLPVNVTGTAGAYVFDNLNGSGSNEMTSVKRGNEEGFVNIKDLPYKVEVDGVIYDTYVIKEKTPPENYSGDRKVLYYKLGKNNKTDKDTNYSFFTNNFYEEGEIAILKVDEDGKPLAGAKFTITRGKGIGGNFVEDNPGYTAEGPIQGTGENGIAKFENLENGVYKIEESVWPFGYKGFNGAIYVTIDHEDGSALSGVYIDVDGNITPADASLVGKTISLTWENVQRFGWIEFLKIKADDKEPLAGATFKLFTLDSEFENPTPYPSEADQMIVTTTSTGLVEFKDLPFGYYMVRETATASDYFVPDDKVEAIFIVNDDTKAAATPVGWLGEHASGYKWPNPKRGKIEFTKVDWDNSNLRLAGAEFKLYKLVGQEFVSYPIGGTQLTKTSDADGYVLFDLLEYGTYRVEETKAPTQGDYYVDPVNPPYVDFIVDATTRPQLNYEHFVNGVPTYLWRNPKLGSITFEKVDSAGKPLAGAQFRLDKWDGGKWVHHENMTVTTTVDSNVVLFDNLPHGRYRVEETTPPSGYFGGVQNGFVEFDVGHTTKMVPENALEVVYGVTRWYNYKLGYIEFYKVDKSNGNGLTGAEFSLYKVTEGSGGKELRAEIAKEVESDANGKVSFTGLEHGIYVVQETKAPFGYELTTPLREQYFEVTEDFIPLDDGNISLTKTNNGWTWPNSPLTVTIEVYKYDITDPENPESTVTPLNGVQFQLFRVDGNNAPIWWSNTATVSNGKASFIGLEAGTYYLIEDYVPNGYEKSAKYATVEAALGYPIVLLPDMDDIETWLHKVNVFNPRITKTITFTKGDSATSGVLAGAVFTLRGNTAMNGVTYEATGVKSDENGVVTFENVPFGTYTLTETMPPKGYAPIKPITNIRVNADTDDVYDLNRINNYPYELVVTKSDAATIGGEVKYLSGAEFRIYVVEGGTTKYVKALEATTADGERIYEYVELVDEADATTFVTGSDGKFTIRKMAYLPNNEYLIKETKAPENYVLVEDEAKVKFDEESNELVQKTVDVPNSAVYGSIEIEKIEKIDGKNVPLEGVVFELRREGFDPIEITTNEQGIARDDNLIYGTYELRELKSKRGYEAWLMDGGVRVDKLLVTIGGDGTTTVNDDVIVKVGPLENKRVVGDVEITKLGSTLAGEDMKLPGAQFLLKPIVLTWDEASGEITKAEVSTDRPTFRYEMSDNNGRVVFENLAYGAYIIEENIAPNGYEKNETEPYAVVQVGLSTQEFESLHAWMEKNYEDYDSVRFVYDREGIEWKNRAVSGSISFQKQDDKGNNLSDALFALYMVNSAGNEAPVTLTKLSNGVFSFKSINGTATVIDTDATGAGFIGELPYGRYILRETKAPDNHMIEKADHEIFIYSANKVVNLVIENPEIEGRLRVIKKDADSDYIYLSGAEVSVYERNEDGTPGKPVNKVVTEIGGTGELGGLKLGAYIAIETKAPDGYTLDSEKEGQPFDITTENVGATIELLFENTKKTYSLRILKVEETEDGELVPIEVAGAQFLVEHAASKGYWYPITNDKGVAELNGIPAGDYTILEAVAPAGYIRDTTVHNVTLDDDKATVTISIVNERIMGGVRIRKLDQDGNKLENAKFELYKDGQTAPMKLSETATNAYVPDENGTVTEITVGEATISGLEAGTYKLTETVVPEGYIKPDDARTFTISDKTHNELIAVDIVNIKAEAAFAIRKVDADDSSLRLQDATFQLFRANTLGVYQYVRSRTTDSTGYAVFSGLEPGSYRVDEVAAPIGYKLWNTPLYFEVTNDLKIAIGNNQYTMIDGVVIATVVNYKSNQYFQVRKVDASTGNVLQNARFSLTGSGDNSSYYTVLTSGASGLTERVSLPAGTYYLQELAAPSGYQRTTATYTVVVDADGVLVNGERLTGPSVFTYEMTNTPDSRTALLYKTDASSRAPLSGAVFSITQRGTGSSWTLSTNSSGRTGTFTLTPGYTYDIVETTTPSGYNRPMQGWTVSVSASGTVSVSGRGIVAYTDSGTVVINIDNTRTTTTTTTTTTPTPGTTTTPRATSTSTSSGSSSSTRTSSTPTDEEPIPLGPGLPRTGQYTNVGLLILGAVIMLISCAALMLYVLKSRKEREGGYDAF